MANAFFASAKAFILGADDDWDSDHRVILGDAADDTINVATDDNLDDVNTGAGYAVATSSALGSPTKTNGQADASDVTYTAVSGDVAENLLVYLHTGTPSTSHLTVFFDTATGLPVTPNGGNIGITWGSYIFGIAQ